MEQSYCPPNMVNVKSEALMVGKNDAKSWEGSHRQQKCHKLAREERTLEAPGDSLDETEDIWK